MTKTRAYRQTRRADSTERTRARILAAAQAAFRADPGGDPSLEAVAERAGVSTRTVIRQFGSKDGLMTAAIEDGVRKLADHYEADGDEVMLWLALAERLPHVRRVTERGTEMHVEWVEAV